MATTTLAELRRSLALALAMLEREQIIDFNGHFSARLPDGRNLSRPVLLHKVWDYHAAKHFPRGLQDE